MSHKPKCLIVLSPGFASSEEDSSCLPMQQYFVKALHRALPQTEIIVLSFQYPFRRGIYKWFDTRVISFAGKNRGGIWRLLLRPKIYAALNKINREKKIIGLLSFWLGECALTGKRFGAKNNIPHHCWMLGQDARPGNKYVRRMSANTNDLIALSDSLGDELEKNYGIRPHRIIPPGVITTGDVNQLRDIDLLAVGTLIPLKQFSIFLEAVSEIKNRRPSVTAVLVGAGPEKGKLEELISQWDLGKTITLAGSLPHPEVLKLMGRAKLLLHPSSYEGFPGVCLEALGEGAKVISFLKPMKKDIENWMVVSNREEMIAQALDILRETAPVYKKIIYRSADEVAKEMASLFLGRP